MEDPKDRVLEEGDCFGILYDHKDPSCQVCTVRSKCSELVREGSSSNKGGGKPPMKQENRIMGKKPKENELVAKVREALEGLEPEELQNAYEQYSEEYEVEKPPKKGKIADFFLDTVTAAVEEDEEAAAEVVDDVLRYLCAEGEEAEEAEEPEVEEEEEEPEEEPKGKKGKEKPAKEAKPERSYQRKSNTERPSKFGERPERSAQKTIEEELAKGTAHDKIIAMIAKEFYEGEMKPATRRFKNAHRKMKEAGKLPAPKPAAEKSSKKSKK